MMYFLDFDRTLFDTNAFIAYFGARIGETNLTEPKAKALLSDLSASKSIAFTPGELAPFVYPDVPEFLRALGNEAVIITHGDPIIQQMKIENALTGIPRVSAIYVGQEPKGPHLAARLVGSGTRALFVDDTPLQLESVGVHCPAVTLYEMRRDGGMGDGRWSVVRSLLDLP